VRFRAAGLALALAFLPASASARDKPLPHGGAHERAHGEEGEEHDSLRERYEFFHKQRAFPNGIPRGARARALRQERRLAPAGPAPAAGGSLENPSAPFSALPTAAFDWALIGPRPIADLRDEDVSDPWSGRVNAIAPDPDDPSTVYLGAASGGVWKTVNNGASWRPLTDDLDSLAVGALAVQPGSTGVVILGTGEPNFSLDSYYGAGIFVSTNGGTDWAKATTNVSADGCHFTDIIFDPADPTNVLASALNQGDGPGCANPGIYRSTDSGQNWTKVFSGDVSDLDVDPTHPTKWYAARYGDGIYHMDNAGAMGTKLPISASSIARIAMAISPSDPNRMYAAFTSSGAGTFEAAGSGIFTTSTGPDGTWSEIGASTTNPCFVAPGDPALPYYSSGIFAFPWYALKLLVDPDNPQTLWVGSGPFVVRFTGGGSAMDFPTFNGFCQDRAHADYHALEFAGDRLWIGNDGGVYSTDDKFGTIGNRNANLTLTQFDPGGTVGSGGVAVGGTQDNGTLRTGTVLDWQRVQGCDGGWSAVNPNNGSDIVVTTQSNCGGRFILRTTNGGATAPSLAQTGITTSEGGLFYAPLVQSPTDPNRLWYGRTHLWTTSNRAGSWSAYSSTQTFGAQISSIGAASDTNTVYVGTTNGHIWSTSAGSGGPWTDVNIGRYVTAITVDPTDSTIAYATVSGFGADHVYKTSNSGTTWTPILATATLDSPANGIAVDWRPGKGQIYVATDIGVVESPDDGTTWLDATPGMPTAVAQNVAVDTSMDRIVVFTHGRGVWAAALGTNPPDTSISGGPANDVSGPTASFVLSAEPPAGATFQCKMDDEPFETCSANPQYTGLDDGPHTFQARAVSAGGSDQSPAFDDFTVDTTAPDTFIDSAPADGNTGQASFTFSSDDPGATFECALDGGGFSACAQSTSLAVTVGTHELAVRARDEAGNVDDSPATAGWNQAPTPASPPPPSPTTTPPPSQTGPTTTPPPTGAQSSVIGGRLGAVKSLSLKALTKGLNLSVTCGRGCTVGLTLANGKKILLRGKATLAAAGSGKVKLKASKKTAAALKKLIGKKLTLTASFTGAGATPEKRTTKLKLKR
jgi:hypothetical protein